MWENKIQDSEYNILFANCTFVYNCYVNILLGCECTCWMGDKDRVEFEVIEVVDMENPQVSNNNELDI